MEEEKIIDMRITKLKNPKNILIIILIAAFFLNLYYLNFTNNQGLWWDEAEYLLKAKNIAFGTPETGWAGGTREIFLPVIWAGLYKLGLSEQGIKFINILMVLGLILTIYLITKELINEKVGLIAAALTAVSYHVLFYTQRLMPEIITLLFGALIIWLFIKWYYHQDKKKYLYWCAVLGALGTQTYYSIGFIAVVLLLFLLITEGKKTFKNKTILTAVGIALLISIPFFIYHYATQGTISPKLSTTIKSSIESGSSIIGALEAVRAVYINLGPFISLFLLIALVHLFPLIKNNYKQIRTNIHFQKITLLLLWFLIPLLIMSYIGYAQPGSIRNEFRYLLPTAIVGTIIASSLATKTELLSKKHYKTITIIVVLFLIIYSLNISQNLAYGNVLRFKSIRDAGAWIKDNSKQGDSLISAAIPHLTYYTERTTYSTGSTPEEFEQILKEKKPKYLVITSWIESERWLDKYPNLNPNRFIPVQAHKSTTDPTMILLVVYEIQY